MTDLEKTKIRTSMPIAFSILVGLGSIAFTLGMSLKDWQDWRKNIEERMIKVENTNIFKPKTTK